jgi:hypothetical protein
MSKKKNNKSRLKTAFPNFQKTSKQSPTDIINKFAKIKTMNRGSQSVKNFEFGCKIGNDSNKESNRNLNE